jgi:hypothetical protein
LIEFLLARKNIEERELPSSGNVVTIAFLAAIAVLVLGGTFTRDFAEQRVDW